MESSGRGPERGQRLDFGPFSLLPQQRTLLRNGKPVRLGARAFDILLALTEEPGALLSRDELIGRVWPDRFVDAVNLRVHMVALRKALGSEHGSLISTDPGRGYRFVAPTTWIAPASSAPNADLAVPALPNAVTRLIGRDQLVDELAEQLPLRRFITLIGPGGVGKTRVAVACAHKLASSYRDGVGFLDLTKVTAAADVPAAFAAALGLDARDCSLASVVDHLRGRSMLLVIDNCEHVIDAAAGLVEAICAAEEAVHILATSREALRALGESVRAVPPLPSPPARMTEIAAGEALTFAAVELFVERAASARFGYQLTDAEAPAVAEICRRLDGIALAIELAAAHLDVYGMRWLAAHLDHRLWLEGRGRRTAVSRHQNLSALLDWSYRLLSAEEQATLRRVAAFPGAFTLAEAIGSASCDGVEVVEVVGAVGGLVGKSLATLHTDGCVTRYCLAETTRAYLKTRFGSGPAIGCCTA